MSPSPDLSPQPPKSSLSNQIPLDKQSSTPSEPSDTDSSTDSPPNAGDTSAADSSESTPPVLRKPPVRPVRPQPPDQSAVPKIAIPPSQSIPTQESVVSSPTVSSPTVSSPTTSLIHSSEAEEDQLDPAVLRQRPIPPPSEPKQYRAIGLVRGRYTSSEEEFTRGTLVTSDGVEFNAVLLGRVMSLVRNHIDLEKDHLWVVYPRTREIEGDLHIQIVGVWEPETLKQGENDAENASEDANEASTSDLTDSSLEDGYFSIRGEVVFFSQEERHVVVKIQQAPRKNSQKGKMFKLSLQGDLDSPKTVGYFWDLHIKRESTALVITEATCIGLAPPKKKPPGGFANRGRPRRPSFGGDRGGGRGVKPPGSSRPSPRREAAAKPIKRSEQNSEG
ncbi:MAG: hypothetical protein HC866_09175 [Leptolyngbyaceae cyanobacterium RU_5_1]|nr:hypothetical protein [Leptolyngbyaceae cyanobacterium RU_5_1]